MSKKLPSVSMSLKLSIALWFPQNLTTSPEKKKKKQISFLVEQYHKSLLDRKGILVQRCIRNKKMSAVNSPTHFVIYRTRRMIKTFSS